MKKIKKIILCRRSTNTTQTQTPIIVDNHHLYGPYSYSDQPVTMTASSKIKNKLLKKKKIKPPTKKTHRNGGAIEEL